MPRLRIETTAIEIQGASPAIIFGHADADGHLATEQTRTNLHAQGIRVTDLVVTSGTRDHRFWERTFPFVDFCGIRLVVVVDIAFRFRNPEQSLESLLPVVDRNLSTHFVVVDHHPLSRPNHSRPNLTLAEVADVYNCCVGSPSDELMVVAAICDRDTKAVRPLISAQFEKRAIGVRRAAADTHGLAGPKLLSLLRQRDWGFFEALAEEPAELHLTVRGRRRSSSPPSPLLQAGNADKLSVPPT